MYLSTYQLEKTPNPSHFRDSSTHVRGTLTIGWFHVFDRYARGKSRVLEVKRTRDKLHPG